MFYPVLRNVLIISITDVDLNTLFYIAGWMNKSRTYKIMLPHAPCEPLLLPWDNEVSCLVLPCVYERKMSSQSIWKNIR
jgi:hypothetical protein